MQLYTTQQNSSNGQKVIREQEITIGYCGRYCDDREQLTNYVLGNYHPNTPIMYARRLASKKEAWILFNALRLIVLSSEQKGEPISTEGKTLLAECDEAIEAAYKSIWHESPSEKEQDANITDADVQKAVNKAIEAVKISAEIRELIYMADIAKEEILDIVFDTRQKEKAYQDIVLRELKKANHATRKLSKRCSELDEKLDELEEKNSDDHKLIKELEDEYFELSQQVDEVRGQSHRKIEELSEPYLFSISDVQKSVGERLRFINEANDKIVKLFSQMG